MKKKRKNRSVIFAFIGLIFLLLLLFIGVRYIIKSIISPKVKNYDITTVVTDDNKVDLQSVIWNLAKKLKVPEKLVKYYSGKDAIYFSFGLNRNIMELYYANAVITGYIEHNGGKLVSGEERKSGNEQLLDFLDTKENRHYVIRVYYGDNKFYPKKRQNLAIIVDDFGNFNGKMLLKFCKLDSNITFAIIPGQQFSRKVMYLANKYHHETLIHMPMEPISYPRNNPGENAIFINQTPEKMVSLIEGYIKELPLCVGANNHMGSLITSNEDAVRIILKTVYKHNLFFIDSHTIGSSVVKKVANDLMLPCYVNYLFMDEDTTYKIEKLNKKFNELKRNKSDKIVVITHSGNSERRYKFLKEIIIRAKRHGYILIPASRLYKNDLPEIL